MELDGSSIITDRRLTFSPNLFIEMRSLCHWKGIVQCKGERLQHVRTCQAHRLLTFI